MHQPNSRFDSFDSRYTPPGDEKVRGIVGRWGGFTRDRRRVSAENYVASPSIMKGPLIMKVAERVPSGGITIFHAYCLTTERLQAPFCLLRYQPPSLNTFSSHRPFLCVNLAPRAVHLISPLSRYQVLGNSCRYESVSAKCQHSISILRRKETFKSEEFT